MAQHCQRCGKPRPLTSRRCNCSRVLRPAATLRSASRAAAFAAVVVAVLQFGRFLNTDPVAGAPPQGWLSTVAPWLVAVASLATLLVVGAVAAWSRRCGRRFDLTRAAATAPMALRLRWPLLAVGLALVAASILTWPGAEAATALTWRRSLMLSAAGSGVLAAAALASSVLLETMTASRSRHRGRPRLALGRRP